MKIRDFRGNVGRLCESAHLAFSHRRLTEAAYISDADAEAAETTVWLDVAFKSGYVKVETHKTLMARYNQVCAQLVTMMNAPEQWCSQHERTA